MIRATEALDGMALHLLLDRPRANILDAEMIAGIQEALDTGLRDHTRLIVLEGAGDHFSFGASVEEHQADQAEEMLHSFHGLFRRLGALGVPTCAVVRGQCLGGGLELASWCTWVVATPDARLGQPEVKLAVFPPMASVLLPWRCGGGAALDLCVSGHSIPASRALELGLVTAITPDPTAWWRDLVTEQLASSSAAGLRFAERAVRQELMALLETRLPALERLYLDELMATHDANEGIAAFMARRAPSFTHR
jgi:cyclohexa-1,5-dienecarbonyl-CoA hydratase